MTLLLSFLLLLPLGAVRCETSKKSDNVVTMLPLAVNSNGWRPLMPSSEKTTIPPRSRSASHPVLSRFEAHMQTAERNKRLQNVAIPNKVQKISPAPPSILGSFSIFGHATVKTRNSGKKKATSEPTETLMPPPVVEAESSQHFQYKRPSEEQHNHYYVQPSKSSRFFPSQQIGEFPESASTYSTIRGSETFSPFYKDSSSFSHTSTRFGENDIKFFPQEVGIQVSGSQYSRGQVQDIPAYSTGSHLSHILPGSTPLASFEEQSFVTTWQPSLHQEPPKMPEKPKVSKRPSQDSEYRYPTKQPFSQQYYPKQPTAEIGYQVYSKPPQSEADFYLDAEKVFIPNKDPQDSEQQYYSQQQQSEPQRETRKRRPSSQPEEYYVTKLPQPETQTFLVTRDPPLEPEETRAEREPYKSKRPSSNREQQFLPKRAPYAQRPPQQDEQALVPTLIPSSKYEYFEYTTIPPKRINEVHMHTPLLPTPLTEEDSFTKNFFLAPEKEKEVTQTEEEVIPTKKPFSRRPVTHESSNRYRRPTYNKEKYHSNQSRRPSHYERNNVRGEHTTGKRRRPISHNEEITTVQIPNHSEEEGSSPTPFPIDSPTFDSRKKSPVTEKPRQKNRPRMRLPSQIITEKPTTESNSYYQWEDEDDTIQDPETQGTLQVFQEAETFNKVLDDDFLSTRTTSSSTVGTTTTTSTTTTTTTTTPPPTSTSHSSLKIRPQLRFGTNSTRPRFSVKDYRERLRMNQDPKAYESNSTNNSNTTVTSNRGRTRGSYYNGNNNNNNSTSNSRHEESTRTRAHPQRFSSQRQRTTTPYTTSTTTTTTTTEAPRATSTERINLFKPAKGNYRPGAVKYYSRYKNSEEPADSDASASSISTHTVTRPKSIFMVTRKPYPLRTRYGSPSRTTTTTEEPEQFLKLTENEVEQNNTTPEIALASTTSTTISTPIVETEHPLATEPTVSESETLSPSQIVADLTSSATSGGYFKLTAPSSKQSNLRITMATEDPILPIEAFFPMRTSRSIKS